MTIMMRPVKVVVMRMIKVLETVFVNELNIRLIMLCVSTVSVAELAMHHDLFAFEHQVMDNLFVTVLLAVVAEALVVQRWAVVVGQVRFLLILSKQLGAFVFIAGMLELDETFYDVANYFILQISTRRFAVRTVRI
jgi:hypothetical protein